MEKVKSFLYRFKSAILVLAVFALWMFVFVEYFNADGSVIYAVAATILTVHVYGNKK